MRLQTRDHAFLALLAGIAVCTLAAEETPATAADREAIEELHSTYAAAVGAGDLDAIAQQLVGDPAFSRAAYTLTVTPKTGGESIQDIGTSLTVSRRQADGSWKRWREIWNSDKPVP